MLAKPEINIDHIMELADIIEVSDDYDQNEIENCICGKACKQWGESWRYFRKQSPSFELGGRLLGLDGNQCRDLFSSVETTPAKTARVLRYLAATGNIDWTIE